MFSLGELWLTLRCWTQYWTWYIFAIISPMKRAGSFICTNTNPFFPSMRCTKFGWNWPSGSRGEDFLKFRQCYFVIITSWEKQGPSFEQTWIGPVVLVKKMKMWKFYRQTDRREQSEKFTWGFSSRELKGVIFHRLKFTPFYSKICKFYKYKPAFYSLKRNFFRLRSICKCDRKSVQNREYIARVAYP